MKKVITFLLLTSFSTSNSEAIISKNSAEQIQFLVSLAGATDQLLPERYKIWPEPTVKIPKPDGCKCSIYLPGFASSTLASAVSENENLFSASLDVLIKIKEISKNNKWGTLKNKIGLTIVGEKIVEMLINTGINNSIKHRIPRRFIKILTSTTIATLGEYIRSKNIDITEKAIDNFIEKATIEVFGELIQRFVIDDPIENKLRNIEEQNNKILKYILENKKEK